MEASCPHLGADLSHADIEECESTLVAVCPWHRCVLRDLAASCTSTNSHTRRYDFDLRTGKSETGLRACTYAVEVVPDPSDGSDKVWIETPAASAGAQWRLVELRPVSEGASLTLSGRIALVLKRPRTGTEFADPPPAPTVTPPSPDAPPPVQTVDGVIPTNGTPKTLIEWAVLILNTPHPTLKASLFLVEPCT
jgi:hypothetical protein